MADDLHERVGRDLRRIGQRYSAARRVLVDLLREADRPLSIAEVLVAGSGLPQSTTYRNLAVLEQAGVVRRVSTGGDYARFELAEEITGRHHHHLVCMTCGSVEDFDAPATVEESLVAAVRKLTRATGFRAQAHRLDLLGTCAQCASA